MRKITTKGLAVVLGLSLAAPVLAIETGIKGLTQNGRIKLGASVLYDLPNQGDKMGPANWIIESKTTYRPNRRLSFIANFWLRGDLSSQFTNYDSPNGGLPDQSSLAAGLGPGSIYNNARFSLNSKNCSAGTYCAEMDDELEVLTDWEDIIRELSVKYKDKKGRFSIKAGRFQRGWGQSDGLRLMDVLHAQDLRQRFAFTDSDELRLPALMVSADFNFRKLGIDGPFKALGMKNTSLEFNFVPETRVSQFIINNPTPTDRSSGGIFGLDWARVNDGETGAGLVGLSFDLHDNKPKRLSFSDAEYSLRLKFGIWGGQATLNAFYGMQDLPVSTLNGSTLIYGSSINSENGTAVIPGHPVASQRLPMFDAATTEAIVHAPGGYLHWLRSNTGGAGGVPIGNPLAALTGPGSPMAAAFPEGACGDIVNGVPIGCSIVGDVDLDYNIRQKIVGFSFARDLSDFVSIGRKSSAPTIRIEMTHEFDHPFNRSVVNPEAAFTLPPFPTFDAGVNVDPVTGIPGGANIDEIGSGVLAVEASRNITNSDITSAMVGFDFPLWVPGWDSQNKSIFTSLQLFDIYTHDSDRGLLQQSPYAFTEVQDHQNFLTFAWNLAVDSESLVFDGLYIRDFQGKGNFYRQRIDFNYFGDSWRPRIEIVHFEGKKESAPIGTFNHSDYIEASLTYQF